MAGCGGWDCSQFVLGAGDHTVWTKKSTIGLSQEFGSGSVGSERGRSAFVKIHTSLPHCEFSLGRG